MGSRMVPIAGGDVLGAAPLALLLYILGCVIVTRFRIPQALGWYTVFFAGRVFLSILLSLVFQFDDEREFHRAGTEQVYGIISFAGGRGYYNLVNALYLVFGANILLPKIVNSFLGSLLPYLAFDAARWMFGEPRAGWRAFLLVGGLPPLVIFSALNLKEIATGFLLVLLVWILAKPKGGHSRKLVEAGVCIWVLYWIRGAPWAVLGAMGVIIHYILNSELRLFYKVGLVVIPSSLLVFSFLREAQQLVWSRTTQEQYYIDRFSRSEAVVSRFLNLESPLSVRNLAVLFLRGIYAPSPLRFVLDYGVDTQIEGINMLVLYVLFPLAVMGLLGYGWRGGVIACSSIAAGVWIIATMGVIVGSDPYRHKMVATGLLAILAAGGFRKNILRRFQLVIWVWIVGAAGFTVLWLTLRLGG